MAFTGSNHLCSTFKKELLEDTTLQMAATILDSLSLQIHKRVMTALVAQALTWIPPLRHIQALQVTRLVTLAVILQVEDYYLSNSEWFSDTNNGFCRFW